MLVSHPPPPPSPPPGNPIHGVFGFRPTRVVTPWDGVGVDVSGNPTLGDLNGDGIPEFILGIRGYRNLSVASGADCDAEAFDCPGQLKFYTLNAKTEVYDQQIGAGANPFQGVAQHDRVNISDISVGGNAVIAMGDVTGHGDGLLDVVIGGGADVRFLRYSGNKRWIQFVELIGEDNPFHSAGLPHAAAPALGDVDGDDLVDAIFGAADGSLWFLRNNGLGGFDAKVKLNLDVSARESTNPSVDASAFSRTYSVPTLFDITGDGQLDLIVTFNQGPAIFFSHPLCKTAFPCTSLAAGYCPVSRDTSPEQGWGRCACFDGYSNVTCGECAKGYGLKFTVESVGLVCRACLAGERSDGGEACVLCPAGLFSTPRSTACVHCAPGTVAALPGSGSCEQCAKGRYVAQRGDTRCTSCPAKGTRCVDGELQLKKGWWYPPLRSVMMSSAAANNTASQNVSVELPSPADNTLTSSTSSSTAIDETTEMMECALRGAVCKYDQTRRAVSCASGYMGPLCGACDGNGVRMGELCENCYDPDSTIIFVVLELVAVMLYIVWAIMFKANASALRAEAQSARMNAPGGLGNIAEEVMLRKDLRNGVMVRFLMDFVQCAGLIATLHSSAFVDRTVFDSFFAAPLAWVCGGFHLWTPLTCLFGDGGYTVLFTLIFPLIVAILSVIIGFGIVIFLWSCCRRPTSLDGVEEVTVGDQIRRFFTKGLDIDGDGAISPCEALERIVSSMVFFLWAQHVTLAASVVAAFDCTEPIHGRRYLRVDTSVACMEGHHPLTFAAGVCGAILYVLGFPIATFLILYISRRRISDGDASISSCFGFLLDGYRRESKTGMLIAYESVLMTRKTILVMLIVLPISGVGFVIKGVLAACIIMFSGLLTATTKPMETPLLNAVSLCSTASLGILCACVTIHGELHRHVVSVARSEAFEDETNPHAPPVNTAVLDVLVNTTLIVVSVATLLGIACCWMYIRCRASHFYRDSPKVSKVVHCVLPLAACERLREVFTDVHSTSHLKPTHGDEIDEAAPKDVLKLAREAARTAKEKAAGLLDIIDEANDEDIGISMGMLQDWAENKSAQRVLEEWASRRMQAWYLQTKYARTLMQWETEQAREQYMLPENRKARLENQERMRQKAIDLERSQKHAKRSEERRLRQEFQGSSSGDSDSSDGEGGGGEKVRDPPNEYDGMFGANLRKALNENLVDPEYLSVGDEVRDAASTVQSQCFDAETNDMIPLALAFTCVLSVSGGTAPALRLLARAGYQMSEDRESGGSDDEGTSEGDESSSAAQKRLAGATKTDSRGLLGSLQSKMQRFNAASRISVLHKKFVPTAASSALYAEDGGNGVRDTLALSRLDRSGAFDVRILFVRAEGLMKADAFGLSDPYVVATINTSSERGGGGAAKKSEGSPKSRAAANPDIKTRRTNFIPNTITPIWNEGLDFFSIPALAGRTVPYTIAFEVFDNDVISADDVIGSTPLLEMRPNATSKTARVSLFAGLDAANALARVAVEDDIESSPSISERTFKPSEKVPFNPVAVTTHWFGAKDSTTGRCMLRHGHREGRSTRFNPEDEAVGEVPLRTGTSLELPLTMRNKRVGSLHVRIWIAKCGRLPLLPLPGDLPELTTPPRDSWPIRSLTNSGDVKTERDKDDEHGAPKRRASLFSRIRRGSTAAAAKEEGEEADGASAPPRARRRSMLDRVLGRRKSVTAEEEGAKEGAAVDETNAAVDFVPNAEAMAGLDPAAASEAEEQLLKAASKEEKKKPRRRRPSTLPLSECATEDLLVTLEARKVNPKRVRISSSAAEVVKEIRAHFGDDLGEGMAITAVLENGDDFLAATKTLERAGFVSRRVQLQRKKRGGRRRKSAIQIPDGVAALATATDGAAAAAATATMPTPSHKARAARMQKRRKSATIQMSSIDHTADAPPSQQSAESAMSAKPKAEPTTKTKSKARRRKSVIRFDAM